MPQSRDPYEDRRGGNDDRYSRGYDDDRREPRRQRNYEDNDRRQRHRSRSRNRDSSHFKSAQVKDRLNGGKERAKESWDMKTSMQKTMLLSGVLAAAGIAAKEGYKHKDQIRAGSDKVVSRVRGDDSRSRSGRDDRGRDERQRCRDDVY